MSIESELNNMQITENSDAKYKYINVFKNPSKQPINLIHLEKKNVTVKQQPLNKLDVTQLTDDELVKNLCQSRTEIIPALDKRWLPKCILYPYEPYNFTEPAEDNLVFLEKNRLFMRSLDYLVKCNYHQFWCTILFEPSAAVCLRSFILHPISSLQSSYLDGEFFMMHTEIKQKFLLVYERLLKFKASETEFMAPEYGIKQIIDLKLLNLPIVITLALLYKNNRLDFVNTLTNLYFNNTSQLDFQIKETEELLKQSILILEMIGGNVCGFDQDAVIVPISVEPRPALFNLGWIYSIVNYLQYTVSTLNILFQFYKPAIDMALSLDLPYRLPYIYMSVYMELYDLLRGRDQIEENKDLSRKIFDEINLGRSEFVDLFHVFVSHCLDKALQTIGDTKQQEELVEVYLKLLNTALEDDYFICDYNSKYNVAGSNELFQSCTPIDPTRTEFISTCISKFNRHKKLNQIAKLNRKTIVDVFKEFKPIEIESPPEISPEIPPEPLPNNKTPSDHNLDDLIGGIVDMFPHLGDGFVLKLLEAYDYNSEDVINAVLEQNIPPHLCDIPFDMIRIPPEPKPKEPIIAFKGKKPQFDDALKLLNDKSEMKDIKTFVLEGVEYTNNNIYDDEYDDRDDEIDHMKVGDSPMEESFQTFNPNREDLASDTSFSSEEEFEDKEQSVNKNDPKSRNFCEDPAVIRARREQRYLSRNPHAQPKTKDVVGKAKGQGQEKNVLLNRQKKNVNKSSRANHSRKSGAQFKRNRGMIPS